MSTLAPSQADLARFSGSAQTELKRVLRSGAKKSYLEITARRKLTLTGPDLSKVYPYPQSTPAEKTVGTQNARCRDLLSYLTAALGIKIVSPESRAVNEADGSVSVEVKGELPIINGMAQFLRTHRTFWVHSLRGPEQDIQVASGFNPGQAPFRVQVQEVAQSWGATLLNHRRSEEAPGLMIDLQAPASVFVKAVKTTAPSCIAYRNRKFIFRNKPNSGLVDNLSRFPIIGVASYDQTDQVVTLAPTVVDKFVWLESVTVSE